MTPTREPATFGARNAWQCGGVTDHVRDAYDGMAERYARLALDDLDRPTPDRNWLAAFVELAASCEGVVADLGCGPGHVVNHLTALGLAAIGYDISPGQIAEAQRAFPDLRFEVGDLTTLDIGECALGGIVARYSLIHMLPTRLSAIFAGWRRMLEAGAPVLVSFFAASSADAHGSPFDHAVATAFELFPATIAGQLEDAGFGDIEIGTRRPLPGERALDHGTILARTANS